MMKIFMLFGELSNNIILKRCFVVYRQTSHVIPYCIHACIIIINMICKFLCTFREG